jgi:D-3-phosphoglycerate dehydrogenase
MVRTPRPGSRADRVMKIYIADNIVAEGVDFLRANTPHEIDFTPGLKEDQVCEHIRDCDAVIVRSATSIRGRILESARKLRVIGRAGIGTDNIDLAAATERGIVVLNTPDANATTTAELAIAHMLSLCRFLPAADRSVRGGKWERSRFNGTEIAGKTLGIVGFGTIGRIVANRALGLRMKVLAFDPFVTPEVFAAAGVDSVDLDALLRGADIVTLHCPLVDKTRNLVDVRALGLMKPGARLVNCARGGLVDEQALHDALRSGRLAGAALDVFENEPPRDSPLLALDNAVFTPHLGASTEEAQTAVGVEIARQIATYLRDGEAINAVNLPRIAGPEALRLRPWQELAVKLGRLLALMASGPIRQVDVALIGQVAELTAAPVTAGALIGLLGEHLSVPVNQVNAGHLARRQGIAIAESRASESHDYLSLLSVTARFDGEQLTLAGTLFDERHPRLVRINRYQIETPLKGRLLFTRHLDQPGVVGDIGMLLAGQQINISTMEVGVAEDADTAIAIIGVSDALSDAAMDAIRRLPAISKAIQVAM